MEAWRHAWALYVENQLSLACKQLWSLFVQGHGSLPCCSICRYFAPCAHRSASWSRLARCCLEWAGSAQLEACGWLWRLLQLQPGWMQEPCEWQRRSSTGSAMPLHDQRSDTRCCCFTSRWIALPSTNARFVHSFSRASSHGRQGYGAQEWLAPAAAARHVCCMAFAVAAGQLSMLCLPRSLTSLLAGEFGYTVCGRVGHVSIESLRHF